MLSPTPPRCFGDGTALVRTLFEDPGAAERAYFAKTGFFPIMHLLGIRRTLVEKHPWLPSAALKAFEKSKAIAVAKLRDVAAAKVTLPFVEERLLAAQKLMGNDFWSYGLEPNRAVLDAFLQRHYREGLSSRLLKAEELFHPSTHEEFRI